MPRTARIVVPGMPHHVTQRGNRRMTVFFGDDDYRAYIAQLTKRCAAADTAVWGYCLMPNHIHLILCPSEPDGLRAAVAETHRRYTNRINKREEWGGHLWQDRFRSFVMDERHLIACARYVELNPVRAGLVARAGDWPWSSARAHLAGRGDGLVDPAPLLDLVEDWQGFLAEGMADGEADMLRRYAMNGAPAVAAAALEQLEARFERSLRVRPRGRPPKRSS